MEPEIKKTIVEKDEFDIEYRHILNYGHTFGHSIEAYSNNEIPHGIGVSIGIDIANYISMNKGYISANLFDRISNTIRKNIPYQSLDYKNFNKMEKFLKEHRHTPMEQNMLENLKIIDRTDMELSYGPMVKNILGNGKRVEATEMELKYGKMEENIWENLKMINCMVKELYFIPMVKNMLVNLSMEKGTAKELFHFLTALHILVNS